MTIIIPSCSEYNLRACVEAIRRHEGTQAKIIIVWDEDANVWPEVFEEPALANVDAEFGVQPFVFARNVNIGIRAAGDDDVLLLNDDALLETPGGFTAMGKACKKHGFGLMGPRTNSSGNWDQISTHRWTMINTIRTTKRTLPFLCAFIPRSTINLVGLLDERFTAYGFEDQDYCRRVRAAGLRLGIYDGCFVDHLKLPSTFRGPGGVSGDLEEGRRIYIEKWGDENI